MCSSAGRNCLANTMGVKLPEARRFQDNFFLKFPKVKDFILTTMQQCREHGTTFVLSPNVDLDSDQHFAIILAEGVDAHALAGGI